VDPFDTRTISAPKHRAIVYSRRVDRQEAWYSKHLPLKDQRIVDVGANVGRISQFFWDQSARSSTLISVEPMPENIAAVERRIRAARAGGKWTLRKCAVSARDGHLKMRRFDMGDFINGVVVTDPAKATATVACRRLESLAPDATVVKVDVEGHEHVFLPETVRAMREVRAWALELHYVAGSPLEGTLALFADQGFRLVGAGTSRDDPDGPWVDVEVTTKWSWDTLPAIRTIRDGEPSTFKMLHLLALR